jgi:hypothetical protein
MKEHIMRNIDTAYTGISREELADIIYSEVANTVFETIEDRFFNGEVDLYDFYELRGLTA